MMLETNDQQVRYVKNFFENRFSNLFEEDRKKDALALMREIVLEDGEDPGNDWLFLPCIENI
jgi:hypothetical protein